jgi:hypothetical protein
MALEKQIRIAGITVRGDNTISGASDTVVLDDGAEISSSRHRSTLSPGDDVSGEDARVQAVANAVWTDEVKAAYAAAQAAAAPAAEESE